MISLISFQQLRDWRLCPQLYAFRHIQKIPEFLNLHEIERGQNLHRLIERDLKGLRSEIPKNLDIQWKNYQQIIQEIKQKNCIKKLISEIPFLFFIEIANKRWGITGRIDLLIIYSNQVEIIDWKSGMPSESPIDKWQMDWYAWCVEQLKPSLELKADLPVQTRCSYLMNGENIIKLFEPQDLKGLHEEFCNHIALMDSKEYAFIPTPYSWPRENWCHYCTYQQVCPEGKHNHERSNFTM